MREPLVARVNGHRLDIERVVRLGDVLVVDVIHGGEVAFNRGPDLDLRVDHDASLLRTPESTRVISPQLRRGPHRSRGHVGSGPSWRAAPGTPTAPGGQGGRRGWLPPERRRERRTRGKY